MKYSINFCQFTDAFNSCRPENFSYEGLKALFGYLEQYEENTGEEIEFDVIAICCEYTEYENLAEFQDNYDKKDYPDMESIENATQVIKINDDRFIIQDF